LPRRGETRFNLFVSVLPPLSSLTRDELLQLVGQLLGEVAGRRVLSQRHVHSQAPAAERRRASLVSVFRCGISGPGGSRVGKTLGCRQRETPSVGWLRALSSLACCCSANLSAASLLEKVATTRPLASPSLTSNTGPSWVTRYVLMALNMTWMRRRPKRAVRDSPSLHCEVPAIICGRPPERWRYCPWLSTGETPGLDAATLHFREDEVLGN
jgi:hypothetical protein